MANIRKAITLALAGQFVAMASIADPAYTATSGEKTTALVELYTSEGCSSCPPADAWLREVPGTQYRPDQLVPLALHVPYWDDLGWKDGFAQATFAQRHSWLIGLNGHHAVFTPHFFVSGVETQAWAQGLDAEVRRVNQMPAAARVAFSASMVRPGILAISSEAKTAGSTDGSSLFFAVTESKLASSVRDRSRTLVCSTPCFPVVSLVSLRNVGRPVSTASGSHTTSRIGIHVLGGGRTDCVASPTMERVSSAWNFRSASPLTGAATSFGRSPGYVRALLPFSILFIS
jgi:hypothetical protein